MEMNVDLLKPFKRSVPRLVFGIVVILFSLVLFVIRIKDPVNTTGLDWFLAFIFLFMGIFHTIEASGASMSKLFGKAFVKINEEKISIKQNIFEMEQCFYWDEIGSLRYQTNRYKVVKSGGSHTFLDLAKTDYSLKMDIKSIIEKLAIKK